MGRFVHSWIMHLYRVAIGLSAAFGHEKAQGWLSMRKDNLTHVRAATATLAKREKWVWFHCASVGEFEQAQPVMEAMRKRNDSMKFMLTFYSPSGWLSFARRKPDWWRQSDQVAAMPLDTPLSIRRFLQALTPVNASAPAVQLLALSKYEIWPELISQMKLHAPMALFAAHVIPGRWPFGPFGRFHRAAWRQLDEVLVQNEDSVLELNRWDVDAKIGGDPRFDRVLEAQKVMANQPDAALTRWVRGRICLVVGSAWPPESRIAQSAWTPGQACIVVPHEWDGQWAQREQSAWNDRGANAIIWSEVSAEYDRAELPDSDVILLDAMGQLMHVYGAAQLALVGGGFGKGVHNTLEPAAHGLPIWVGPKVERFAEVQGLYEAGGLTVAEDEAQCAELLRGAWRDADRLKNSGLAARNYALKHAGSGIQIAKQLMGLLTP